MLSTYSPLPCISFNLGVGGSFYVMPLLAMDFTQERTKNICCVVHVHWGADLSHLEIQFQFGWQVSRREATFTMELNRFGLTNVRCSLSGEWPNTYVLPLHHAIRFKSQYLHDATFTIVWVTICLGVTSPCIFSLHVMPFSSQMFHIVHSLDETFARPLRYTRRVQGYPHGRDVASSRHVTTDTVVTVEWPNIYILPLHHTVRFESQYFTWCHFYCNLGNNVLDATSPCISI